MTTEPPSGRAPDAARLSHASDLASIRACIAAHCLLVPDQAATLLAGRDAAVAAHADCSNLSHAEVGCLGFEAREQRAIAEARGRALEEIGRAVGMAAARAEKDISEIVRTVVFMGERYGPISQIAVRCVAAETERDRLTADLAAAREALAASRAREAALLRLAQDWWQPIVRDMEREVLSIQTVRFVAQDFLATLHEIAATRPDEPKGETHG